MFEDAELQSVSVVNKSISSEEESYIPDATFANDSSVHISVESVPHRFQFCGLVLSKLLLANVPSGSLNYRSCVLQKQPTVTSPLGRNHWQYQICWYFVIMCFLNFSASGTFLSSWPVVNSPPTLVCTLLERSTHAHRIFWHALLCIYKLHLLQ